MASDVVGIFQAVLDWPVLATMPDGSQRAPTAFGFASMPNSLSAHQLPCRLISVFGDGMDGTDVKFLTMGGGKSIDLFIDDTILLLPTGHGRGVGEVERALMQTFQAYSDLAAARIAVTTSSRLTRIRPTFGQFPFPFNSQGATFYYGVSARLTISELS